LHARIEFDCLARRDTRNGSSLSAALKQRGCRPLPSKMISQIDSFQKLWRTWMRSQIRVVMIGALIGAAALPSTASAMGLSFSWSGTTACGSSPPAFTLSGVPKGTSQLAFNMVDLNLPSFQHGGGSIAYHGNNRIPGGSFSFTGPCPPSGQHTYQWTVKALDANGKVLATASASRPFPPR
jgi:hypothetical protein